MSTSRFTSSLIYFALSLFSTHLTGSMSVYLSTFLGGAIEVPVNVVAIFVADRRPCGRRVSGCVSFVVAGVTCFLTAVAAVLGEPPRALATYRISGQKSCKLPDIRTGFFLL